jgi:signal transduction histidine kinase
VLFFRVENPYPQEPTELACFPTAPRRGGDLRESDWAMGTELRKTGIDALGNMPWGTHFCNFYETKDDLLDILIPYFAAGLENGEFCIWILSDPIDEAEATNALIRAFPQAERHLAVGDIKIVAHSQWYLSSEAFDRDRVIKGLLENLAQALAKGYTGMRVNGNTSWLTEEDWRNFMDYERGLNELIANRKIIVLCTYPLRNARATALFDIAHTHQFAIAKRSGHWDVLETPELVHAKQELHSLSRDLEQRVAERTIALADANEQLRALSARLISAREEEDTRIARELHDELGSALSSLKWDLEEVFELISKAGEQPPLPTARERLEAMMRFTDATITTVGRITSEMRPLVLDALGLVEAIEWQAQQFQARTRITCHCELRIDTVDLTREQSTAVFRISQEALTNILRHARAKTVHIVMEEKPGVFVLTISDDGQGITEEAKSQSSSLGLLGMQERARLAGGNVVVTGVLGKGTTVIVRIPRSAPQAKQ